VAAAAAHTPSISVYYQSLRQYSQALPFCKRKFTLLTKPYDGINNVNLRF
jgi:hypothetical protein